MRKNTAVLTGSTSEIGTALARLLLKEGFHLVNIDRNSEGAQQIKKLLLEEFPNGIIENFTADLSDTRQVKKVAQQIRNHSNEIHLLFNNAGVLLPDKQMTEHKVEMHFAVNTLAPYLLTKELLPCLQNTNNARVVVSGSGASQMARKLKVEELINPKNFKAMSGAYAQSKAAIKIIFASMQNQYQSKGVNFLVVDLPPTKTKMARSEAMPNILKWLSFLFSTPEKSAEKLFNATLDKKIKTTNKTYLSVQKQLVDLVESLQDNPVKYNQ